MNEGTTVLSEQEAALAKAAAKAKGTISAKVYRAATDTWEDLGVISETEVSLTEAQMQELLKENNESKPQ